MKKVNFDILLLTSIMCLVPILFGLYFYQDLPDMVAVHFDINNNPNGFIPRELFVFGIPLLMMFIQIFVCIGIDIKSNDVEQNKKSIFMYKLIIPIITVLMYVVIIKYAITFGVDMIKVAMIIMGVIFIIIGIDLPTTTKDSHINFPKINDERIYVKTKKIFGLVLIIDGILALISCFLNSKLSIGVVGLVILEAIVLIIFAIYCNRKFR